MAERRGRGRMILTIVVLAAVYWAVAVRAPSGARSLRSFDANRLAELEVGMWQAYYAKEKTTLVRLLVVMLREQYHLSWQKAAIAGWHFGRAASAFGDADGAYEKVLPDLESGYSTVRDGLADADATFDPAAVAKAELAWWTARRDPALAAGTATTKNRVVAERMTELYALLYGVPKERVAEAARGRVDAAGSARPWGRGGGGGGLEGRELLTASVVSDAARGAGVGRAERVASAVAVAVGVGARRRRRRMSGTLPLQ